MDDTLISRQMAFQRYAEKFYDRHPALHETPREDVIALLTEWDGRGDNDKAVYFGRIKNRWPGLEGTIPELIDSYWPDLAAEVEPDEKACRFLRDLTAAGLPWGILTNGPSEFQRGKLARVGLAAIAPFALVPSETGDQKPSAVVFLEAARLAGHAAAETLFVGDNPRTDIRGAQAAGMPAAWIRAGREWADGSPLPDHQVDHVTELRGLLLR